MNTNPIALKGLIVSDPWFFLILIGDKTREMRPKVTSYRGPLALIRKGAGVVQGMVDLVDCISGQHEAEYEDSEALHHIPKAQHKDCAAKWPVAWVFANARLLTEPVPYKHRKGAQSRILLSDEERVAVFSHDPAQFEEASAEKPAHPMKTTPKTVKIALLGQREFRITTSNIENHSLPLRSVIDFFPTDVLGGSSSDSVAHRRLTIIHDGRSTDSDIDRSKWILRDRRASREFFSRTAAKAGDVVVIDKLADYVYAIRLKGQRRLPTE